MNPWLILTLAGLVWAGGYAIACALWPFARCTWCSGTGRKGSPSGRYFRPCWWCKGTARRLRLGRRLTGWILGLNADT